MNTSGVQRGYMAKNMKVEDFISVVVTALSREFEEEVKLESINNDEFEITLMPTKL
jgi:lipoate-protein ligase A